MNRLQQTTLTLLIAMATIPVKADIDTTGRIGHWTFSGDATDQTVNENDGTVFGATLTKDRFGNDDEAYYFDGDGDYIDLGKSTSMRPNTLSVNLWFRLDDTTDFHAMISCRRSDVGEHGMDIYHHKDFGIITSMGAGSSNKAIGHHTLTNYNSDDWHMITFVYDYNKLPYRFATYIDGKFLGYENRTGSSGGLSGTNKLTYDSDVPWIIGADAQYFASSNNLGPRYFKGALDDITIYNRALSADQVDSLYKGLMASTRQNKQVLFDVYPNPATDHINISVPALSNEMNIIVYSLDGRKVVEETIIRSDSETQLPLMLRQGIYIMELRDKKMSTVSRQKVSIK